MSDFLGYVWPRPIHQPAVARKIRNQRSSPKREWHRIEQGFENGSDASDPSVDANDFPGIALRADEA